VSIDLHARCDDPVEAAAQALVDAIEPALRAQRAPGAQPCVRIALSGGSASKAWPIAARKLGEALSALRLTWVDERCVPVADASSNRGATHRISPARAAQELPLWLDDESPAEAVARVRSELRRWGAALDVTLLGMGADGHIASLFPGRAWDGELVRFVDDSPKPPPRRMTLTRDLLCTARASILLATGESKRTALMGLLAGDARLPAVGLPHLSLFTDLDLSSGSQA